MLTEIAILSPIGRNAGRAHGGITPVVTSLAAALDAAGRTVELVTFSAGDPRHALPHLSTEVRLYNLGAGGRRQHKRRLGRYLEQRRPIALLAAGHRANLLAAGYAGGQARIVLSVHNALSPGLSRLNPLRRWLRLHALNRCYPSADAIVCVSNGVADDLGQLAPATRPKIKTLHNPIATADHDSDAPLHPWLTDGSGPVILGAGRLAAQKDFATLIQAFAGLEHNPPARLLILGEGPDRDALLKLATELDVADRVALPGFVPNPRTHMAAAALFVLSSRWEGFGNVLVEAMAMGTPVVATDCPSGPNEILNDGRFGQLVAVGDRRALRDAIAETLVAEIDPRRLRERAAEFSPELVAERYLKLLLPEGHR
ncbi:MAG: glycosyltransferase [Gammaproteobacteria bacterium]|jgi:glycosyltransferase involved in cell wall biosynthesis|nr:glycosyltransferase [Gammaproteobacteria bacterium]